MKYSTLKRAHRQTRYLLGGLLLTAVVTIAIPLSFPGGGGGAVVLLAMSGLCLFLAAVTWLQNYANYTFYETQPGGLFLRGVYKKGTFSYEEIASCEWLSPEASAQYINETFSEIARGEAELDLYSWWQANKKYGRATKYATVQAVHHVMTSGSERNITDIQSSVEGSFLVLKMKNGDEYILTPADPEAMAADISGRVGP